MAEPVRTRPETQAEEEVPCTFVRWVKGADGRFETRDFPLTPEAFLDPRIGDTMVQGNPHGIASLELYELLRRHFLPRQDVLVLHDVKHLLEPRRGPAPDVSVILGAQNIDRNLESYNLAKTGIAPSLIIEVVSPTDSRIRRVDEEEKVGLYARVGVAEYILEDMPRPATGWRYRLRGYRLDDRLNGERRYRDIPSDSQGRLLSKTTGLLFGVSPQGDRIEVTVATTGERILYPIEEAAGHRAEKEARQAAEERAAWEAEARKAAEAEVDRLRREIERLRCGE
jgi:Uma2 family endonuclease